MTLTEYQQWLIALGQDIKADGKPGPATRAATKAVFVNTSASAVTEADIVAFADKLGCTVQQIKAVAKVESGGGPFDKQGRPKMLFERHLFHKFTGGAYGITPYSNPRSGGYNEDRWEKLAQAACKDAHAAFAATSWGEFQVLGAHARGQYRGFLNLGYSSPLTMAYCAVKGEAEHYEMLLRYITAAGLRPALAKLSKNPDDCRAFAEGYNGPKFEDYNYHRELARAMGG